jgi:N-acetylglutamate synthase-like GNAT family acetyltransferase
MKIRPLRRKDIASTTKIIGKNYSHFYGLKSSQEMGAMFDNMVIPPKYLVAEEGGEIIGCGGYIQSWMDYHVYNIFWINVDPTYQRKGIGTQIVRAIISDIKKQKGKDKRADLILLTTTKPKFYQKRFGFKTLTKFGGDKDDLMALDLR